MSNLWNWFRHDEFFKGMQLPKTNPPTRHIVHQDELHAYPFLTKSLSDDSPTVAAMAQQVSSGNDISATDWYIAARWYAAGAGHSGYADGGASFGTLSRNHIPNEAPGSLNRNVDFLMEMKMPPSIMKGWKIIAIQESHDHSSVWRVVEKDGVRVVEQRALNVSRDPTDGSTNLLDTDWKYIAHTDHTGAKLPIPFDNANVRPSDMMHFESEKYHSTQPIKDALEQQWNHVHGSVSIPFQDFATKYPEAAEQLTRMGKGFGAVDPQDAATHEPPLQ